MKEERFFYDEALSGELPEEEARHALRVLRLQTGDEIRLMDGKGAFLRAEITTATGHRCFYRILSSEPQQPAWSGYIHLAMAPTKMNERVEWMAEKATEIGFDELSFLDCQFSERHVMKIDRIDRILVSSVKQSHKARKPKLNEMIDFRRFVEMPREGDKYICHCYDGFGEKPLLDKVVESGHKCTVLIGPEGDFSVEEVQLAIDNGYKCVSLGRSRLRTETAALAAVHIIHLKNEIE